VSLAYPGYIDSDMGAVFDRVKTAPVVLADRCLRAWEAGELSVFPDLSSSYVRDALVERAAEALTDPYKVMAEAGARYVAATQHLLTPAS
jgi:hypothetical protein